MVLSQVSFLKRVTVTHGKTEEENHDQGTFKGVQETVGMGSVDGKLLGDIESKGFLRD